MFLERLVQHDSSDALKEEVEVFLEGVGGLSNQLVVSVGNRELTKLPSTFVDIYVAGRVVKDYTSFGSIYARIWAVGDPVRLIYGLFLGAGRAQQNEPRRGVAFARKEMAASLNQMEANGHFRPKQWRNLDVPWGSGSPRSIVRQFEQFISSSESLTAPFSAAVLQQIGDDVEQLVRCLDKAVDEIEPVRDFGFGVIEAYYGENLPAATATPVAPQPALEDVEVRLDTLVALCAKPFLILTGPSGTGKTREIARLAMALDYPLDPAHTASQSRPSNALALVPVGADWNDARFLLGYRNPFGEKRTRTDGTDTNLTYEVTPAVRLMLRASHPSYKDQPHFLLLDEMNLSHVERYFSSFLSIMEADRSVPGQGFDLIGRDDLALIAEVLQDSAPAEAEAARLLSEKGSGLGLPLNMFIVGTVNVDETTYMFSPKVLDRAHVIEPNAPKPMVFLGLEEASKDDKTEFLSAGQALTLLRDSTARRESASDDANPIAVLGQVTSKLGLQDPFQPILMTTGDVLNQLFDLLSPVGFAFGPRAVNEIYSYIACWLEEELLRGGFDAFGAGSEGEDDDEKEFSEDAEKAFIGARWHEALDRAILQKILPKIHGNRRVLGDVLDKLATLLEAQKPAIEPESRGLWRSAAKARRMHQTLQASGYTSFI